MDDSTTTARPQRSRAKAALAWLAILGLLALVLWLAAERNARTWHLVPDEGRLVVMRGMLLPVGRQPFETSDPALAQAYAPVVPPPGKTLPGERTFEERSFVDQALFELLAGWAREEIASGDQARLERGLGYLVRAEKLPGLSPAQREDLGALRAESGYHEALRLVAKAADELREAAEKLRRAGGSRSSHATDASLLLRDVEPAADAALGAARAAHAAAPSAAPAAPTAQPAQEPKPAPDAPDTAR
jgi:hypothetical protein